MKNIKIDNINFQATLKVDTNRILFLYTIAGQEYEAEFISSIFVYEIFDDDNQLQEVCLDILKETMEKFNLPFSEGEGVGG